MRWPDEENRQSRDIDAVAEASGLPPLAIEHTELHTFINKKLDSARFMQVCAGLEGDLNNAFTANVSMIVDTFAVQPGSDWKGAAQALRNWLLNSVPSLPEGRSDHSIPGVPFRITIFKEAEGPAGFTVGRWTPNVDLAAELEGEYVRALENKSDQLAKYAPSAETILLVESQDIALVSPAGLFMASLRARKRANAPNVRQVWLAKTYENWVTYLCFFGPETMMEKVNPPNSLMVLPRYTQYWDDALRKPPTV